MRSARPVGASFYFHSIKLGVGKFGKTGSKDRNPVLPHARLFSY
jgi:hypothetical protein